MATREEIRYSLQRKLTDLVGEDEAAELMTQSDMRGELLEKMGALDSKIGELRGEVLEKIGALDSRIGALDSKIGELRGEVLEKIGTLDSKMGAQIGALDGRIAAQTWRMYGASFVSAFSTAGLVLAVVQLSP